MTAARHCVDMVTFSKNLQALPCFVTSKIGVQAVLM